MWPFALLVLFLLFVYPYAIYPAVLYLCTRRRRGTRTSTTQPPVAMVICALNEERVIGEKVQNCLALDYPPGKLRIIVVSDGSTDGTARIARECARGRIEVIEQPRRRGKIANLNEVVPRLAEEIVVLSDANVMYRPDAVTKLVRNFEDPTVGCVSGKVILTDSAPALDGPTGGYYSLEWFLQAGASALYSMAGADGAMYALRRELFQPCPTDTLIEDFVIPMTIVRQGARVVHEPEALGWEQGPASLREEFRRKVRIAAGAAQGLLRGNIWPPVSAPARFWFVFVSHKLLRWLSPVVALAIVVCAAAAIGHPAGQAVVAAIVAISLLALVQVLLRSTNRLFSIPFYFVFGQVAVACGLLRGLTGHQTVLWAKENR